MNTNYVPSLFQAPALVGKQDGEVPAIGVLVTVPMHRLPPSKQNGHSAMLVGSRVHHLEGKDVAEKAEGQLRLLGWSSH